MRRWLRACGVLAGLLPLLAAAPVNVMRPVTLQSPAADAEPHPYCAVLDADVFAETAPGLRGLHLMQDGAEIPFITTVSEPASAQTDAARILRLREENGALVFDLEMPARAYTEIHFRLRMKDFVATAAISAAGRVEEFKLFDLSREHLARQTTVQLPEMRESVLHVALRAAGKTLHADDLEGVDVGPDRAGQSLYTVVAETARFASTARETIAELDVPAHVPVQRIRFATKAANFLRRVRVEAWPADDAQDVETISGEVSSTHREGLADTQLMVPMTLGANLQGPAHVRVIVEDDGDAAVALTGVALEMREHKICFDAKSGTTIELVENRDEANASTVQTLSSENWDRAGKAVFGGTTLAEKAYVKMPPQYPRGMKMAHYVVVVLLAWGFVAVTMFFIRRGIVRKARG